MAIVRGEAREIPITGDSPVSAVANRRFGRILALAAASVAGLALALSSVDFAQVSRELAALNGWYVVLAAVALAANALVGMARFRSVLAALGYRLSWSRIFIAFSAGQAGNQFLFNIIGQSLTRATALQPAGVPFGATIAATLAERMIAASLLLGLSLVSAWFLIPEFGFSLRHGGLYFLNLLAGLTIISMVVAVSLDFRIVRWVRSTDLPGILKRYWAVVALTVLSQACMLLAYVAALRAVGPTEITFDVVAALLIVMFTASLPIALAGWGVREFTAVVALSAVGVGSAGALLAALTIGVLSLALVLAFGAGSLVMAVRSRPASHAQDTPKTAAVNWNARVVLGCGVVAAVAIYFQIRINSEDSLISVNLADLIALGGFGMGLLVLATRRSLGAMPFGLAAALALVSVVLLQGLVLGWMRFGWIEWALLNRGLGWLVVAGYPVVAVAIAAVGGEAGRVNALRIFIIAGATIAGMQLFELIAVRAGLVLPNDVFIVPLEGYANNANAFAFQLVVTTIAVLIGRDLRLFAHPNRWPVAIVAIAGVAVFFASSRAGVSMYALALVLFVTLSADRPSAIGLVARAVVIAIVAIVAITYIPALVGLFNDAASGKVVFSIEIYNQNADSERWTTIAEGLELWLQSPVLGSGLGAYMAQVLSQGREMIVIHSTPVWIMAEMGLFGLALVGAAFAVLLRGAFFLRRDAQTRGWGTGAVILLICVGAGNMVHDLFLQRSFWFLLGLCLAVPGARGCLRAPDDRTSAAMTRAAAKPCGHDANPRPILR